MSFLHPLRPSDSTHLTARQAGTRDEDPEIQGGMVSPDTRHHWLRYKIIFAISTVLGMTIAGITSYLLKGIERHDTPTYISNIFDVINAWVGVIYQLITLIEDLRGKETSFTHLRIIIPALIVLLISGLSSVIWSTIILAADLADHPSDDDHALTRTILALLITCLICNWVNTILHIICLVHLIHQLIKFKKTKTKTKTSGKDTLAISLSTLTRQMAEERVDPVDLQVIQ